MIIMPVKQRRYSLKAKESKQILTELSTVLKLDLEAVFGSKANLEIVESEVGLIYLVSGKPLFFQSDKLLPMLTFKEFIDVKPKVVVDMGAVPYVCKGADVMAPGIVRYEGEFSKGDLVVVVDMKYGKPLALGETLYSSEEAKNVKKGAVLKTKHYVSDKIWNFAKLLSE
jgi:PUA domain protein